ncbi:MAG: hypothetical protein PVJ75_09240 [Chloroflexota bacterium]|jgi:hypothetical protein
METPRGYVFILKAWQEGDRWRWSLMRTGKTDRLGFSDLDSLYLFLSSLTEGSEEADENVLDRPGD